MTATLADPVSEVVAAAQQLLTKRTGAPVSLVDPVDLGGSGQAVVLRVRVAGNPFQLPRTLVIKQVRESAADADVHADEAAGSQSAFLREAASYQFATALATDSRPGPDLLAYDLDAHLLVLSDLGDASPITALLKHSDEASVTNSLMAMAQALGRMHAATVGREDDFAALLRRVGLPHASDGIAAQIPDALAAVPRMLTDDLGLTETPSSILDRVERSGRLFAHGAFRAFSPADLCPDNIIVNDEGVRFLDYEEWGGFRDATLDITYALASFPGCLCHFDLSADRAQEMIDAWRAEVVGIWPHLADDQVLASKILDAQLIWVWLSTYWFLPNDHARIAAARAHHLSVPRSAALVSRWGVLVDQAVRTGAADVAEYASQVVAALRVKWDR